jgi:hypothetical protein
MDTAYGRTVFPDAVRPMTHPARLGARAGLMGREAALPRSCRVPEIGAGDNVNLIVKPQSVPQSEFVGVGLPARAVARRKASSEKPPGAKTLLRAHPHDHRLSGLLLLKDLMETRVPA